MNFAAYLLLLGLTGTVCGNPVCPNNCELTTKFHHLHFQHVPDLKSSSVAPWELRINETAGREPQVIQYAECMECSVKHMIAKPINILISVYQRARNNAANVYCKCPYLLAVGCTCIKKQ